MSHPTVARWTDILERVYAIFRVPPFGAPTLRAVKKERKHCHYDWAVVPNPGARFENLVASHLLKWVEFQIDTQGRPLELRYFRDAQAWQVSATGTCAGKPSGIAVDQIRTLSKSRLTGLIGKIDTHTAAEVRGVIRLLYAAD